MDDFEFASSLQKFYDLQSPPSITNLTNKKDSEVEFLGKASTSKESTECDPTLDYAIALSLQEQSDEETKPLPKPNDLKDFSRNIDLTKQEDLEIKLPERSNQSGEMDESLDYAIALSLQDQPAEEEDRPFCASSQQKSTSFSEWDPKQITDSTWETVDPNPNIHNLFVKFDAMFFKSLLTNAGVAVSWSKRMTLCAGLCSYEGRGRLCSIRLSEPLLKLRPRKDLVETLLHEMIHALLFITANNKDRESHGPEFRKHMDHINEATGANITIYHSFRNEVKLYQQHWWKCNGPCQTRPPFFGMVRRAVNRAPSPHDTWWSEHAASCGGTFLKIKEPEGYSNKKNRKKDKEPVKKGSKSIADMFKKATDEPLISDSKSKPLNERTVKTKKIIGGCIVLDAESSIDSSTKSRDSPAGSSHSSHPSSHSGYKEIRSKMLEAATKRLDDNQKKGSIKRPHTKPYPSIKPPKKQKLVSANKDILVIDDEGAVSDCSSTVSYRSDISTASIELCSSPSDDKRECPVCGRRDIPYQVINIHIEYCLEEMELEENEKTIG